MPKFSSCLHLNHVLFGGVLIICLILFFVPGSSLILIIILLTLLTFLSTMLGSLFSVYVPLSYNEDNMSAPVAGLLDALIYLGGAVSTFVLGHILVDGTLKGVTLFWIGAAAFGILIPMIMPKPVLKGRQDAGGQSREE